MSDRVAITGLGAVSPLGVGADALIDRWCAGEVAIADGVAACSDFEPGEWLTVKQRRRADRFTQLALVAAVEALEQAGWSSGLPVEAERIGCIVGTGVGGIGTIEDQHDILRDRGAGALSPLAVPLMMANAASGVVAIEHGLKGECYGTVSACAAGAHAVGAGMRLVRQGVVDACVVGGSEAGITPLASNCFVGMGATSKTGISRPFDARRDGFVMAEGAGILLLEAEETARARGARVLAELAGYGATSDAYHITQPDERGEGAARAMRLALTRAGLQPDDIGYVNAHGTSTQLNDRLETLALRTVFGAYADALPVSSTKSMTGHTLGAVGGIEFAICALAARDGLVPPTINYQTPDPDCDLNYVPNASVRHDVDVALSNSFGFGGHNCTLAIRRYRE